MLYAALKTVHLLSIIVWIGGMVFAQFFLRPAAAALEPSVRLPLLREVLRRFYDSITVLSLLALFTGLWMVGNVTKAVVQGGGDFSMPLDWKLMSVLGALMVLIFGHIRFVLFRRFAKAVDAKDWPAAGGVMKKTSFWMLVNLALGLTITVVTLLL